MKTWFGKNRTLDPDILTGEAAMTVYGQGAAESVELAEDKNEWDQHAYMVALATAAAAEAAAAAAHAAVKVVHLTGAPCYLGKSNEQIAAAKIQ